MTMLWVYLMLLLVLYYVAEYILRTIWTILRASCSKGQLISPAEICRYSSRVRVRDLDYYFHVNNASCLS